MNGLRNCLWLAAIFRLALSLCLKIPGCIGRFAKPAALPINACWNWVRWKVGHTYMLQERGAASILAIEANTRAFLKCLIVKNIFNLHKADFRCGDFISFLRQNTERFDFVLATGVLYHMTSPVELLQLLSRVTDRLFMWTHYYDEAIISRNPNVLRLMAGSTKNTHAGFTHTLHRHEYKDALKVAFTGGTKSHSCWMERDEILACLHYFGYGDIRIAFDETDHLHGPCFAVLAQR